MQKYDTLEMTIRKKVPWLETYLWGMDMRKQIAVMMCAVNLDNQRKMLEGMIDAAKETDSNLYVFTNYISYREKEENIQGAYQIMYLPDMQAFDAAIIAPNTIQYPTAAEQAAQAVYDSGIPAVSIDMELPGMSYIGISSYEIEMAMMEHFILEHDCDEIYYVSGPLFHTEGEKRYRAYCDALEKHGMELKEEYVYHGFFNTESGEAAAEEFLKDGKCPQAIVCGNDAMAIGVIQALKRHGYHIPEDVLVAGFDNGELSELQSPTLTTVNKNQHEVGYRAVYDVLAQIDGAPQKKQYVPCKLEIRRSCGCRFDVTADVEHLKERYVYNQVLTQNVSDIMRNMMADFAGMETPGELVEALKKYIMQTDIENFYLCLCDKERLFQIPDGDLSGALDILQVNTNYTDRIHVPLAYEGGEFRSYGKFPKGLVLPEECRNRSGGNCYVVATIFYQRCCYGYCVSGNSSLPLEHSLYYSWLMNIGIGLENIRKWMLLKDTVVKLNGMWVYDMLTHLYNRAGFFHYAKTMLEDMQKDDEEVFLLFMDIDGLKQVNDEFGHEAGDELIRGMAEIIKQCLTESQIAMRYGGDEFVIFGSVQGESMIDSLIDDIRTAMARRNRRKGMEHELRASIGASKYRAHEILNLDELIEQADKRMYEEKRRKKKNNA